MDGSRRDVLKGTGGLLAAGFTSSSLTRETAGSDFSDLEEKIDERRDYRDENGGATIYLGSVDSLDLSVNGGFVYDDYSFEDVERMLDEGETPEEIVNSDNEEFRHSQSSDGEVIRDRQEQVKLVYMSEDESERPLESYSESLQKVFAELDPSIDLDVSVDTVRPDSEDLQALRDVSSGEFKGLEADLDLKTKYSENGQEPVFLVENDILPDAGGVSDYLTGVAFVELVDNEDYNRHVVNHETGHSLLGLPHHFHEDGAMSYNPQADHNEAFHPRTRMMAKALLTGDTSYRVVDETAQGIFDGEQQEKNYKQIEIEHESRDLEKEAVTQDFFHHLDTYAEQVLGYDMSAWTPESHEIVEEDSRVFDVATYSHRDGSEMSLKIDHYVEEMNLEETGGK